MGLRYPERSANLSHRRRGPVYTSFRLSAGSDLSGLHRDWGMSSRRVRDIQTAFLWSRRRGLCWCSAESRKNLIRHTDTHTKVIYMDWATTSLIAETDNISILVLRYCETYHGLHSSNFWAFRKLKNMQTARNDYVHESEKSFARLLSTSTVLSSDSSYSWEPFITDY